MIRIADPLMNVMVKLSRSWVVRLRIKGGQERRGLQGPKGLCVTFPPWGVGAFLARHGRRKRQVSLVNGKTRRTSVLTECARFEMG